LALQRTSQSPNYHHLTNREEISRTFTQQSIENIKIATKEIFGETPTNEAIWKKQCNIRYNKEDTGLPMEAYPWVI